MHWDSERKGQGDCLRVGISVLIPVAGASRKIFIQAVPVEIVY
jgi:hypothetical protein